MNRCGPVLEPIGSRDVTSVCFDALWRSIWTQAATVRAQTEPGPSPPSSRVQCGWCEPGGAVPPLLVSAG